MVPGVERSPRLFGELRQMHAGLIIIDTPEPERWRLLAKLALDGMHPGRRAIIDYLVSTGVPHSTASVAGQCRMPKTPVRRHLEELNAHGVVDLEATLPERWTAGEWLRSGGGPSKRYSRRGPGMSDDRPLMLRVFGSGRFVGVLRHGAVRGRPIHAAACVLCGDAIYDTPTFLLATGWLGRHLFDAHGARIGLTFGQNTDPRGGSVTAITTVAPRHSPTSFCRGSGF